MPATATATRPVFPLLAKRPRPACPACQRGGVLRVMVTGSRPWKWPTVVWQALEEQRDRLCPSCVLVVVHGHASEGVDAFAHQWAAWAEKNPAAGWPSVVEEKHPANWNGPCRPQCEPGPQHRYTKPGRSHDHCPQAGHHRNQDMVDTNPHLVLVFSLNDSNGTWDAFDRVRASCLPWVARGAYAA